jgi:hypothetical protein
MKKKEPTELEHRPIDAVLQKHADEAKRLYRSKYVATAAQ